LPLSKNYSPNNSYSTGQNTPSKRLSSKYSNTSAYSSKSQTSHSFSDSSSISEHLDLLPLPIFEHYQSSDKLPETVNSKVISTSQFFSQQPSASTSSQYTPPSTIYKNAILNISTPQLILIGYLYCNFFIFIKFIY
jgi:hypothetical protein